MEPRWQDPVPAACARSSSRAYNRSSYSRVSCLRKRITAGQLCMRLLGSVLTAGALGRVPTQNAARIHPSNGSVRRDQRKTTTFPKVQATTDRPNTAVSTRPRSRARPDAGPEALGRLQRYASRLFPLFRGHSSTHHQHTSRSAIRGVPGRRMFPGGAREELWAVSFALAHHVGR